jgi:hypothetical protein
MSGDKMIHHYNLKYAKIHLPRKMKGRNWMAFPIIAATIKYHSLSFFCRSPTVTTSGIVGAKPRIAKINNVR